MNLKLKPFCKWAGGKTQLLPALLNILPSDFDADIPYCEPFIGGGALLWKLQPNNAFISDKNADLINAYKVVRDYPVELIDKLDVFKKKFNSFRVKGKLDRQPYQDYYYELRDNYNNRELLKLNNIEKTALFLALNKTCFNGIYRINSQGGLNSPAGYPSKPEQQVSLYDFKLIKQASEYLNKPGIIIQHLDFEEAIKQFIGLNKKGFVYLDPPYWPLLHQESNFNSYTNGGFELEKHYGLRDLCRELSNNNIHFLQSNSYSKVIDLYRGIEGVSIRTVGATRAINSDSKGRSKVKEILIKNYSLINDSILNI